MSQTMTSQHSLASTATPFMWGQFEDNPVEPVAWTNINKYNGRVFYTSLGHPDDFDSSDFTRMLSNGIQWAANIKTDKSKQAKQN